MMTQRQRLLGWVAVSAVAALGISGCTGGHESATTESAPTTASSNESLLTDSVTPRASNPTRQIDRSKIEAPEVPLCPYAEEVFSAPPEDRFATALELGCEYNIHGAIEFSEPTHHPGPTFLISDEHAMTLEEMLEAEVITQDEYEHYLDQADNR